VTDATGRTLTSAATAGKEPALTLKFRDGALDVVPAATPRPSRTKAIPSSGEQPKLL
jgi:exodeoxyribonuclease VII large subunit